MNWKKLAEELIPVAATLTGNPLLAAAATQLEAAIEGAISNKIATTGATRDVILADAKAQYAKDIADADALLKKGHENDPK